MAHLRGENAPPDFFFNIQQYKAAVAALPDGTTLRIRARDSAKEPWDEGTAVKKGGKMLFTYESDGSTENLNIKSIAFGRLVEVLEPDFSRLIVAPLSRRAGENAPPSRSDSGGDANGDGGDENGDPPSHGESAPPSRGDSACWEGNSQEVERECC